MISILADTATVTLITSWNLKPESPIHQSVILRHYNKHCEGRALAQGVPNEADHTHCGWRFQLRHYGHVMQFPEGDPAGRIFTAEDASGWTRPRGRARDRRPFPDWTGAWGVTTRDPEVFCHLMGAAECRLSPCSATWPDEKLRDATNCLKSYSNLNVCWKPIFLRFVYLLIYLFLNLDLQLLLRVYWVLFHYWTAGGSIKPQYSCRNLTLFQLVFSPLSPVFRGIDRGLRNAPIIGWPWLYWCCRVMQGW